MRILQKLTLILLIASLTGCMTTGNKNIEAGDNDFRQGNYDAAIDKLSKINSSGKGSRGQKVKAMLFRAKLAKYYEHLAKARQHREKGAKENAVEEYNRALGVFPHNNTLIKEIKDYVSGADLVAERKKRTVSDVELPAVLAIDKKKEIDLNLRSVPVTSIFKAVGKFYGVNFIFDKDFKDFVYSIEIDDIDFDTIVRQLCLVANCRPRILGDKTVLIYPDSAFKKRHFALKGVKVFYLSNLVAKETAKLVLALFRDQQIILQEDAHLNCLIVKGTSDTLKEIELFINKIDKEKSEVLLDVEILEVNRTLINKLGTDLGASTASTTLTAGQLASDGKSVLPIFKLDNLKNTSFFASIPSVALHYLGQDENNTIIAKPNLRGVDGEAIKFMVGDEVPIKSTTFGSVAAGGVNTVPQTSYEYKNVGIEIKITPHVHGNNEVTLKIKLTMNFITSYNKDDFPILGKRELESVIRLKEGETNIIGGFIKDEDKKAMKGTTGLMKLPLLGKLFGHNDDKSTQTDILFAVTPRVIRKAALKGNDLIPVWSGDDNSASNGRSSERDGLYRRRVVSPPPVKSEAVSVIAPSSSVPAGQIVNFPIVVNTKKKIKSVSLSGSVSGGTIVGFTVSGNEEDTLKHHTESGFNLGISGEKGATVNKRLGVLKVKFKEKGNAAIQIDSISASSEKGKSIDLKVENAEIKVK